MQENAIGREVIGAAIRVHRELGPGLLESVYEIVLLHELRNRGIDAQRQVPVPVEYCGLKFDEGFRADTVVESRLILELKAVDRVNIAHRKQLLTYLRLARMRLGYILNFSQALMVNGITRIVNRLPDEITPRVRSPAPRTAKS